MGASLTVSQEALASIHSQLDGLQDAIGAAKRHTQSLVHDIVQCERSIKGLKTCLSMIGATGAPRPETAETISLPGKKRKQRHTAQKELIHPSPEDKPEGDDDVFRPATPELALPPSKKRKQKKTAQKQGNRGMSEEEHKGDGEEKEDGTSVKKSIDVFFRQRALEHASRRFK